MLQSSHSTIPHQKIPSQLYYEAGTHRFTREVKKEKGGSEEKEQREEEDMERIRGREGEREEIEGRVETERNKVYIKEYFGGHTLEVFPGEVFPDYASKNEDEGWHLHHCTSYLLTCNKVSTIFNIKIYGRRNSAKSIAYIKKEKSQRLKERK
ncbi:hypothetical protein C1646_753929 [Rhizophagus diaphanus]|nr:hypothetical protein C1646_753929 [Rhizophagus diaphanus] [Rhizophagus sp. MUCL 43196]